MKESEDHHIKPTRKKFVNGSPAELLYELLARSIKTASSYNTRSSVSSFCKWLISFRPR